MDFLKSVMSTYFFLESFLPGPYPGFMIYFIYRFEKIKTSSELKARELHNRRDPKHRQPNHDSERLAQNQALLTFEGDPFERWKEMVGDNAGRKPQTNGVMAMELLYGMSPGSEVDLDSWKSSVMKHLADEYGEENLFSAYFHDDETTPHIQAIILPRKKLEMGWRLNAGHKFGGSIACRMLQDRAHKACGEPYGLLRGEPKSETLRDHTSGREYFAMLSKHVRESGFEEAFDSCLKRVGLVNSGAKVKMELKALKEHLRPLFVDSVELEIERKRNKKLTSISQYRLEVITHLEEKLRELKAFDIRERSASQLKQAHQFRAQLEQEHKTTRTQCSPRTVGPDSRPDRTVRREPGPLPEAARERSDLGLV